VDVIAAGTPVAALAAKAATTSIPIVFGVGSDPVKNGLVPSLSRPGGNVTGVTFFANLLPAKRTELLHEIEPNAKVVGLLSNPRNANAELESSEVQKATLALGLQFVLLEATNEVEIDNCFATVAERHMDAIVISGDALFYSRQGQIAEWAIRNQVLTSFPTREQVVSGGLMSYGASVTETFRLVGIYVGRILKGERPANLPILQPTKRPLVVWFSGATKTSSMGFAEVFLQRMRELGYVEGHNFDMIYRFSETRDLEDAKALLDELAA
jgi:putative ABC transport system substrate-binding protein